MIPVLLVLNAGSSSLKFQVFALGEAEDLQAEDPRRIFRGLFEGLGTVPHLLIRDSAGTVVTDEAFGEVPAFGHEEALLHVAAWLRAHSRGYRLAAVGHRVVHGGLAHASPMRVDGEVLGALERLAP